MTWSDDVYSQRTQLARANGTSRPSQQKAAHRSLAPPAALPSANSGLGPIALVSMVVASTLYLSKEGHKMRGRKLPPFVEKLRSLLLGGLGRTTGSRAQRRPASAGTQQPHRPSEEWQQQSARYMAVAAAEQRMNQQNQQVN